MTYRETLEYLYARLPMFHRIGSAAFKKDLGNTLALCAHLGNPHRRFPSVHVGGTNGKGSVSHMLAAAFQSAGHKTGLYTSPHYIDFRERIKINGEFIPKKRVVRFVEKHREVIESIQPSFFELCVAMSFDYFADEAVDVAVIEVGLGGRLDSTNVIRPMLSVITNISYDHQNLLGDTLQLIAGEKAGIIKPGVPVVIGETHPESAPVFLEKARLENAPIRFADREIAALEHPAKKDGISVYDVYFNEKLVIQSLQLDAAGPFQHKNLATALKAMEVLSDITRRQPVSLQNPAQHKPVFFQHFARSTYFIGRWQLIGADPAILCDSAHNEAGLRMAFERIAQYHFRELHIVTGFVNDKEVEKVLTLFPKSARYYFTKADIPRGLDATILREKALEEGLKGKAYRSVRSGLAAARKSANKDDLILVIGSIFVVAEVLPVKNNRVVGFTPTTLEL